MASAQKWGGVQRKITTNMSNGAASREPVTAAQPQSGGTAPAAPPITMFSVLDRDTGEWLGQAGPWQPEGWPGTEVGWSFKRSAWGKGYAHEAAVAAIDWAFDQLGWTEVIHSIAPDNVASQALARRLGSTNRGPGRLPDPFADVPVEIWGQSREQWRARQPAHREP